VTKLSAEQLQRLARLGAIARLQQLKEEEATIRQEFPELFGGRDGARTTGQPRKRRRRRMSAAQRKAVSERMTKYWAARRKAKGK
jgi:hypothetical protein